MKLGDIILNYRTEHGLSQRQFALRCGLSNGTISNLEKGINPNTGKPLAPSLELLNRLAVCMGMTVTELLVLADDMPISLTAERVVSPIDEENVNSIRMVGRDGTLIERTLTDEQMAALRAIIEGLPDAPDDI